MDADGFVHCSLYNVLGASIMVSNILEEGSLNLFLYSLPLFKVAIDCGTCGNQKHFTLL